MIAGHVERPSRVLARLGRQHLGPVVLVERDPVEGEVRGEIVRWGVVVDPDPHGDGVVGRHEDRHGVAVRLDRAQRQGPRGEGVTRGDEELPLDVGRRCVDEILGSFLDRRPERGEVSHPRRIRLEPPG